jgi:L-2-hydroxyglutarate oxidase LhgO
VIQSGFDFDAAVVGAGVVGLACGWALARRGLSTVVLEKEAAIGQGVSSRNSEVIHAGFYYPAGSLKARLCVEGRRALYAFLERHGVAFDRCGKLLVATSEEEVPVIEALHQRGLANGVEGLEQLTSAQARALEPQLSCTGAILSPESGVVDSHGYMLALQGEIEAHGGVVALRTPFEAARPLDGGGFRVRTGGEAPAEFATARLVIAAGLGAQGAAAAIEGFPADLIPGLHLGKGVYFSLAGPAPFRRLIYPTPAPGSLGCHYRRDLGGQARIGPDLEYVDHESYGVDPARAAGFYDEVRRYWPGLKDGALEPDYAGERPKLHGPGEPQPDFRIDGPPAHGLPGLVALFGIESPGLTSSLAIGEEAASRLGLGPSVAMEGTQSGPVED